MKRSSSRRKSLFASLTAVLVTTAVVAPAPPSMADVTQPATKSSGRCAKDTDEPPAGTKWKQTFGDEFNSRRLDASKWNTYMDFPGREGKYHHNGAYLSYALDKNIVLDGDGLLKLRANKETIHGTDPVGTFDYSEGFIASFDKFYQLYGYFEICAKFPAGKGMWPAFWTGAQDRSWPPEFDIAEWFGGGRADAQTGIGVPVMNMSHAVGSWPDVHWNGEFVSGAAPSQGWHTYGLEWRPGYAAYYIDGVKHHEVVGTDKVPDKAMYLILNSGVTGVDGFGGAPDAGATWPNDFEIDFVRAYQDRHAER